MNRENFRTTDHIKETERVHHAVIMRLVQLAQHVNLRKNITAR